jgi:hypothetical protein
MPVEQSFALGSFWKIIEVAKVLGLFFHDRSYALILTNNVILGDFLVNPSGHPEWIRHKVLSWPTFQC